MTFVSGTVDFHGTMPSGNEVFGLRDVPGIERYVKPGVRYGSAFGPTHDIRAPAFDATLWRYMDFAKFVSLLEGGALFFTRLDKLGDPFEGAWSDRNLAMIGQGLGAPRGTKFAAAMEAWRTVVANNREQRRYTLVNCWHAGGHESEAMWKLYAGQGYGLAIKTDFKSLVGSFTKRVPDVVAEVEYISYETGLMPWSLRAPFLHKRLGFAHEREVRAVMQCFNFKPHGPHQKYDYSTDVCEVGLPFPVDPADLIREVVVSPYAESWLFDLVRAVCARYGMADVARRSEMARTPNW